MDKAKEVWLCEPRKNVDCRKTGCYIYGGPCRSTTNEKCALTAFGEKYKVPVDEVMVPVDEVMNKNGPV